MALAVGGQKFPTNAFATDLNSAPWGALVAGFSAKASPTTATDFPNGFTLVGSSATVTAAAAGNLFLTVNDYTRSNNIVDGARRREGKPKPGPEPLRLYGSGSARSL